MLTPADDPEAFVTAYRANDALLDSATDALSISEYRWIKEAMEKAWKEWQGEDCLREMAFGEPS